MSAATTTFPADARTAVSASWRRRVIAIALMLGIAGFFWIDSRYPALLRKYHSGAHVKASGAITFDALYPVDKTMPLTQRVWRTSLNWLAANKIGMTFGFFFGAAALTFLSTLRARRTRFPQLNALIGALAGMPLGVCANCVAPIGRGFYASGMSTESVLAAMIQFPNSKRSRSGHDLRALPASHRLAKARHRPVHAFRFRPVRCRALSVSRSFRQLPYRHSRH